MKRTGGLGRAIRAGPACARTSSSGTTYGFPGGAPADTLTASRGAERTRSPPEPDTTMEPVFPSSSGRRRMNASRDGGFCVAAHAAVSNRMTKQLAIALLIQLHREASPPDPDGGHRCLEPGGLGSELADEAREVGHGPPGKADHQAELPFGRREEEVPDDEAAFRADGKRGIVPQDDAHRTVRTGHERVADGELCPHGGGKNLSSAGDGGLSSEVPNHADGIRRRGVEARRQDEKRHEN